MESSVTMAAAPATEPARAAANNTMKRDVFEHLPEFYKAVAAVLISSGRLSIVD